MVCVQYSGWKNPFLYQNNLVFMEKWLKQMTSRIQWTSKGIYKFLISHNNLLSEPRKSWKAVAVQLNIILGVHTFGGFPARHTFWFLFIKSNEVINFIKPYAFIDSLCNSAVVKNCLCWWNDFLVVFICLQVGHCDASDMVKKWTVLFQTSLQ